MCFRFCMLVPPRKLRNRDFTRNLRFQHYPGGLHASLKAISVKVEPALVTLPQNDTLTFLSRQARGGVTSFRWGPRCGLAGASSDKAEPTPAGPPSFPEVAKGCSGVENR